MHDLPDVEAVELVKGGYACQVDGRGRLVGDAPPWPMGMGAAEIVEGKRAEEALR